MGGQPIGSLDDAALGEALRAGDDARVRILGETLGVLLECESLGKLNDLAQWRLTLGDVLRVLRDAACSEAGVGFLSHKSHLVGELGHDFVVAVRLGDRVLIGSDHHRLTRSSIHDVWPELTPWRKDLARNRALLESWAAQRRDSLVEVPVAPRAPTNDAEVGHALLQTVLDRPDDDVPRAVYADWLLARGDLHGELIRAQLDGDADRARALLQREGKLLAGEVAARCEDWRFERGFVAHVTMNGRAFARHAHALFAQHPIQSLALKPFEEEALDKVCSSPYFARLRALASGGASMRSYLTLAPLLGRDVALERLSLLVAAEPAVWCAFGAGLCAPALRSLALRKSIVSVRLISALAANPHVRLTTLNLNGVSEKPGPWAQLAGAPPPGRDWGDSPSDARAAFAALGHGAAFATLARVRLGDAWGTIDEAWLRAWLLGPNAARLVELDLRGAGLTAQLVDELIERRALPALSSLVLDPEPRPGREALHRLQDARPSLRLFEHERFD